MTRVRTLLRAGATTLLGAGMVIGLAIGSPQLAHGDPDAVADTKKKVQTLEEQNSQIDLKHAQLSEQLDQANAKAKTLQADIAAQRQKVDSMKQSMGKLALTQYQNSGIHLTAKLLASKDDDALLSQLSTVQNFTNSTNGKLQVLQSEQATLTQQEASLQNTLKEIRAAKDEQAKLKSDYQSKLTEAEGLLTRLTSQERARLEELRREEASRQLDAARQPVQQTSSQKAAGTKPAAPAEPVPAASGGAATAVAFAKAQVGKAYVLGSTGPNAYDCSGLTGAAWRAAGVSLPRTSQGQAGAGVKVSLAQIQPGDLVIFYSGASHVGIYVGGGMIVDAANPRAGVRMISLHNSWMPIHSVRRVG